jgi:hypothetical protein
MYDDSSNNEVRQMFACRWFGGRVRLIYKTNIHGVTMPAMNEEQARRIEHKINVIGELLIAFAGMAFMIAAIKIGDYHGGMWKNISDWVGGIGWIVVIGYLRGKFYNI